MPVNHPFKVAVILHNGPADGQRLVLSPDIADLGLVKVPWQVEPDWANMEGAYPMAITMEVAVYKRVEYTQGEFGTCEWRRWSRWEFAS